METFPRNVEIAVQRQTGKYSIFIILMFLSCGPFPKDPEKTLEKITNGTLKVGYSENLPWVYKTENGAGGVEAQIIKNFAATYNAQVEWINSSEEKLFDKLEKKEIDIIIAGITSKTPWKKKKVGLTRPYQTETGKKHVMAVKQGENQFQVALEKFLFNLQKTNVREIK